MSKVSDMACVATNNALGTSLTGEGDFDEEHKAPTPPQSPKHSRFVVATKILPFPRSASPIPPLAKPWHRAVTSIRSQRLMRKITDSRAVFVHRLHVRWISRLVQETQNEASIFIGTLVQLICLNLNCAQRKTALHSRWNFISHRVYMAMRDERWPTEVTSNIYLRGTRTLRVKGKGKTGNVDWGRMQITPWGTGDEYAAKVGLVSRGRQGAWVRAWGHVHFFLPPRSFSWSWTTLLAVKL